MKELSLKELEDVVSRLRDASNELQSAIATLERVTGTSSVLTPPDYMINPLLVCRGIEKEGGVVSKSRFHEIGKEFGYDVRGLGGFFVGKNAWLVSLADEKVALTKKAEEWLNEYREWLESRD